MVLICELYKNKYDRYIRCHLLVLNSENTFLNDNQTNPLSEPFWCLCTLAFFYYLVHSAYKLFCIFMRTKIYNWPCDTS